MKNIVTGRVVGYEILNCSFYGNPRYFLTIETTDGELLRGKTKTDGGIVETLYAGDEIKNGNTIIPLKYMPERFYQQVMDYGEVGFGITAAMDEGTEEDVKRELCKYIKDNEYNEELYEYINSVNWL